MITDFIRLQSKRARRNVNATIKLAHQYQYDPDRISREMRQRCLMCHYRTEVVGRAMTQSECKQCYKVIISTSTAADVFCKECAQSLGACVHCGADIDLER